MIFAKHGCGLWNIIINLIMSSRANASLSRLSASRLRLTQRVCLIVAQGSSCVKILLLPVVLPSLCVSLIVVCAGFLALGI